jgi:type II secretory pathway component PulK
LLDFVLTFCGASSGDSADIGAALKDWVDRDDFQTPGGAESADYYLNLTPPYVAKNGPIDSMDELLKVRGITPQLFWGPRAGGIAVKDRQMKLGMGSYSMSSLAGTVGLVDIVRATSSGQLNINTASFPVLVAAFNGEEGMARNVIQQRAGPDGVDGTLDDTPARNPGELGRLMGAPVAGGGGPLAQFTTASQYFEIHVDAHLGQTSRRYVALVQRFSVRDLRTLTFRAE